MHKTKNTESLKPGWRRVKFGDVVRKCSAKADPETSGLERYIAGDHMDTDDLRLRRWGEIGTGYLGPAFHMHFRPGQVLYGSRRTYLRKVAMADFEGICANTTFVLEPKDRDVLVPQYLPFLMQTDAFNAFSVKNSKGSVNPYINFSDLATYEFLLPSSETQRRLVEIMSAYDESLEGYRNAVVNGKRMLDSLREDIFSHHSVEHSLWDLIVDIQAGKSLLGANESPRASEKAVLKVSAVGSDGLQPKESKILLDQAQFLAIHTVKNLDVLITRANTPDLVGMVCLVEGDFPNLMLCDKTLRLVPKVGLDPLLLSECLKTVDSRQYLRSNATGTGGAMKNISQAKLKTMPIRFPTERNRGTSSRLLKDAIEANRSIRSRILGLRARRNAVLNDMAAKEV